ncbi:hypothetical protein [Lewinella cohaerens]|uniref:hypothetical protein n=1 Tax=Lewinella cohaerens TaxID=70995 RepID=UPI00037DBD4B|nr:hypothetical protein [Lewinella cohaerens]
MIQRSQFLGLISFSLPFQVFACECRYQPWFDLLAYDQHTYVMEIEVLSQIKPPVHVLQESPAATTTDGVPSPPPLPPPPPHDYEDFNIRVLTNFKGDETNIHLLRASNKNSSCFGAPQAGQRYLVYADGLATQEGHSALVITSACQRKIPESSKHFEKEKELLLLLKGRQEEAFVTYEYDAGKLPILTGGFKKGQRSGAWKVYNPYATDNPEVIVRLRYRRGVLVRRKFYRKELASPANVLRFMWKYEYE